MFAATSKGQLVGLENISKEKLGKNVTRQYNNIATAFGVGLEYCCGCFKETVEMSLRRRFQWCQGLLLPSNFTRRGLHSTTQKELPMKMLFQYSDNPERELKLGNVQLPTVNVIVFPRTAW